MSFHTQLVRFYRTQCNSVTVPLLCHYSLLFIVSSNAQTCYCYMKKPKPVANMETELIWTVHDLKLASVNSFQAGQKQQKLAGLIFLL